MHQCYLISYGSACTTGGSPPGCFGGYLDMQFTKPEVEFVGTKEQCKEYVKKLPYMTIYTIGEK